MTVLNFQIKSDKNGKIDEEQINIRWSNYGKDAFLEFEDIDEEGITYSVTLTRELDHLDEVELSGKVDSFWYA